MYKILPVEEVQRLALLLPDIEARNGLILCHMPMCIRFATRHSKGNIDDLVQEAVLGVCEACDRYDPAKGRFSTYVYWWIRKYVYMHLRAGDRIVYSSPDMLELLECPSDVPQTENRLDAESLLGKLRSRDRYVVWESAKGRPQVEIGKDLGVSKQAVSLVYRRAMGELNELTRTRP